MASLCAAKPCVVAARPAVLARRSVAAKPRLAVVRVTPPKQEAIEGAIKEAEEACAGGSTGECAAAWDTVEELSAAASHAKASEKAEYVDPLEKFCETSPDADECRVFED